MGYSFCLAVKLLQDRTSSVASRAHYCLSNLSISTLKVKRVFCKGREIYLRGQWGKGGF